MDGGWCLCYVEPKVFVSHLLKSPLAKKGHLERHQNLHKHDTETEFWSMVWGLLKSVKVDIMCKNVWQPCSKSSEANKHQQQQQLTAESEQLSAFI